MSNSDSKTLLSPENIVYRPPVEAASMILEVSIGCSYGKCTFCQYLADKIPLQLIPREELISNLINLSLTGSTTPDLFLTGGNVLAFKTAYLLDTFNLVHMYLPYVQNFRMYARADDVLHKSREELSALASAGLDILYIGIESGNNEVLTLCNKGETRDQMLESLSILEECGIQYGLSSILGLGGKEHSREHTEDTISFYNQTSPASIRVMTLTPFDHSPLADAIQQGRFHPLVQKEILEEELLLLENLKLLSNECLFVANHVSNAVPLIGFLPSNQEQLITILKNNIQHSKSAKPTQISPGKW
ncbi:radical SAM protein [Hespellia stercorisuis]|uniref:Fe-S oxidoreductase n=1 Tax=Hespellia stercorisuis DSM 15480 TaxID=1121950 RepID=A0A1M6Q3D1_9FIRM|nr:radical SAM protein [Hespellia stercorisuis]SHK14616.1 Fe-S oxidoreductase [Hespellia stercorisuis DSM 15480]